MNSCKEKATIQPVSEIKNSTWWKDGGLYQLYPQSFKDTIGDGFGDFSGVIEELDYLKSLGINLVWMNPFFESPLEDNGYDDYQLIQAEQKTIYAETRISENKKMLVLLNFSKKNSSISILGLSKNSNVLINNYNRLTIAKIV